MILYFLFIIAITFLYSWLLWKLDRYEHEPLKLLLGAFFWGAVPAILLSLLLEITGTASIKAWVSPGYQELASASLLAPVVEESVKALALLGLFKLAYWEFDDPMDGILYGGLVGFGFAMVEDFAYVSGSAHPMFVTAIRTIPFGLNHAFFTGMTGAAFGYARLKKESTWRYVLPIVGLLFAMTFHAIHNLGVTVSSLTFAGTVLSFISDWMGVLWLLVIALISLKQERKWIKNYLTDEVGSYLSEEDFEHITSSGKKLKEWLNEGSPQEKKLRKRLYDLSVNLAFKKAEMAKNITDRQNKEVNKRIEHLRKELSKVQDEIASLSESSGTS